MAKIFVGVTHKPWFDFLAGLAPEEVNFWQPSGTGQFKALALGDLFLFKLEAPWNAIAGGGVFEHASLAVWLRGLLGGSDDTQGLRESIRIGRSEARVHELGLEGQALLDDLHGRARAVLHQGTGNRRVLARIL
jgi:hypothetical protein